MERRNCERLKDRAALVFGAGAAAQGIGNGRAAAIAYAREGAAVICVDRDLDRATATAELIAQDGGHAVALVADATSAEDVRSAVEHTVERLGRIDILHNNVGAATAPGDPTMIEPEDWDRDLAINTRSAFLGIKYAVPVMRQHGGGVITNISSTLAVRFVQRPLVAYSAAKAAVEALTRACAVAYGPDHIRVNAIRVGFIETPMALESLDARAGDGALRQQELERSRARVPLQRHGEGWDVAGAAVFLASAEASYVNGVVLDVDGGVRYAPV